MSHTPAVPQWHYSMELVNRGMRNKITQTRQTLLWMTLATILPRQIHCVPYHGVVPRMIPEILAEFVQIALIHKNESLFFVSMDTIYIITIPCTTPISIMTVHH
jgi:hypothetical protein